MTELEHLRETVRRIAKRCDTEHKGCRDEDGRRKGKWLDRSILSPAQRDAFDRAVEQAQGAA